MSVIKCIECLTPLQDIAIGGCELNECPMCGALRARRDILNTLRRLPAAMHSLLSEDPTNPWKSGSSQVGVRIKRCPSCKQALTRHAFGGGNIKVDSCSGCEMVYLQSGALAALVKETHHGVELSEEANAILYEHRVMGAANRLGAAEAGLGAAGLVAAIVLLRIVLRLGFSASIVVGAVVIASALFLYQRRKYGREHREASEHMQRVVDAETFRLDQKKRDEERRQKGGRDRF